MTKIKCPRCEGYGHYGSKVGEYNLLLTLPKEFTWCPVCRGEGKITE